MGAGLHQGTRGGRPEEWREEPGRARVHAHGLTLVHTHNRAHTGSCTHVHMLTHTRACLGTQTPTRVPTHSLSHTITSTLILLHIMQGRARRRSHAEAGTHCWDSRVCACPRGSPQAVSEWWVSPGGGCPAGTRADRHSTRQPPRWLLEGVAGVCPQQCPLLSSCTNPLRVWILDGFCRRNYFPQTSQCLSTRTKGPA